MVLRLVDLLLLPERQSLLSLAVVGILKNLEDIVVKFVQLE